MSSADPQRTQRNRIGLGTSLVVIAAIAAECALVVQIRRCYAAVPSFASPACPEWLATPAVLLWIILASLAGFAIRKCSVTRFAYQVAISCVLVMSRLGVSGGALDGAYAALWPAVCFGLFFVTPHLLIRFSRANDGVLVLADASVVTLLTYVFALQPYVPML
jgi:hypothetical protein